MVDTLQDISVDQTEAPSVTQHLNDTITDGIPVNPVSNAGPHRHITHAVPKHIVSDSVMENPGPDLAKEIRISHRNQVTIVWTPDYLVLVLIYIKDKTSPSKK